jgi:hypothetical protein
VNEPHAFAAPSQGFTTLMQPLLISHWLPINIAQGVGIPWQGGLTAAVHWQPACAMQDACRPSVAQSSGVPPHTPGPNVQPTWAVHVISSRRRPQEAAVP